MKVLVCGGRDYADLPRLTRILDTVNARFPISQIIHGNAAGADSLAALWASKRSIDSRPFPADWNRYSYRAGPVRNAQMLREGQPDLVIAFPGGKGTRDMIRQSHQAKVKTYIVKPSQAKYKERPPDICLCMGSRRRGIRKPTQHPSLFFP
jgi:hypothetical protein